MTHISLVPLKGQIYCPPGCIVKVQGVGDIQCEHALQSSCEHGLQSSCEHGLQSSCGICFVWCLDMPDRQTIVLSFNYMYSVYTTCSRQLSVQSCMVSMMQNQLYMYSGYCRLDTHQNIHVHIVCCKQHDVCPRAVQYTYTELLDVAQQPNL